MLYPLEIKNHQSKESAYDIKLIPKPKTSPPPPRTKGQIKPGFVGCVRLVLFRVLVRTIERVRESNFRFII